MKAGSGYQAPPYWMPSNKICTLTKAQFPPSLFLQSRQTYLAITSSWKHITFLPSSLPKSHICIPWQQWVFCYIEKKIRLMTMMQCSVASHSSQNHHNLRPRWEKPIPLLSVRWYWHAKHAKDSNRHQLPFKGTLGWASHRQLFHRVTGVGKSSIALATDGCLRFSSRVTCKEGFDFFEFWEDIKIEFSRKRGEKGNLHAMHIQRLIQGLSPENFSYLYNVLVSDRRKCMI